MNVSYLTPTPGADKWLATDDGNRLLRQRTDQASRAFLEAGLGTRLQSELLSSQIGGSKVFRIGNSVRTLSEELAILAFAHSQNLAIASEVWEIVLKDYLPILFSIKEINFQGRNNSPPWKSDLWTADIGVNLAWVAHFSTPLISKVTDFTELVRTKCLNPIMADWLDDKTRLHSLDSMGHNWWSVIVAGAGIMAVLLGEDRQADMIARNLVEWFHFPGNELSRKQPNFGIEGDYVESFHYAEYALAGVCILAHIYPQFRWVPDGLSQNQARGLADWLKRAFLATDEGWRIQRFGDVGSHYRMRTEVWHSIARLIDDHRLLELAHRVTPHPHSLAEFMLWEPRPAAGNDSMPDRDGIRAFPTSGIVFDTGRQLSVSIRSGETWNHNHLDAGTFVLHQDNIIWVDDAGTCNYNHPDYLDYYVAPCAHNIAYAPSLSPPCRRVLYEGLPATGRILAVAGDEELGISCVDTGVLSGNALARSYRWFFRLGNDGILIWDDLAAYTPERFECLLHTECEVSAAEDHGTVFFKHREHRCAVQFFCDMPQKFQLEFLIKGEPTLPPCPISRLSWRSDPVDRVKFGLSLGTRFQTANWSGSQNAGGWKCDLKTADSSWLIWFNPLADGRVMHQNRTSFWTDYETDAYALILHKHRNASSLAAIDGSFVRQRGTVIHSNLTRQMLMK